MEVMDTSQLLAKIILAENYRICPECGARMTEMDRACEGEVVFVWYRCGESGCTGQWLTKTPRPYQEISSERVRMAGGSLTAI